MSSELDLRRLHRAHEPDPAFVERLRRRIEAASTDAVEAERVDEVEVPLVPIVEAARPARRRRTLAVAAAIALLAVVGGGLWTQRDGSGRTIFAGGPDSPFVGHWVAVDSVDRSSLTMQIAHADGSEYELLVLDDYTSVCSGVPSTMTGTGQLRPDGALVVARPELVCDDGTEPVVLDGPPLAEQIANLTFVHDAATGQLQDSIGVVWRREGANDASAPTGADTMWPQSTLEEVREAQARADAGDPAHTWQVDPQLASEEWWEHLREPGAEIVERFLRDALGWDQFLFNPYQGDDGDGAADGVLRGIVYLRCTPGETNPLYPIGPEGHQEAPGAELCAPTIDDLHYEAVSLDLSQLARRGSDGIWVVSRWAMTAPFAQTDPNIAEAETTALLGEFLGARVAGEGAEGYVEVAGALGDSALALDDVPLLYATTAGAPYERYEIERAVGPWWPFAEMEFTVRLFADGGETVVEQPITSRDEGHARPTLVHDATRTTENGQNAGQG